MAETSAQACSTFEAIIALRQQLEGEKILSLGTKAKKGGLLLNHLYQHPIVDGAEVSSVTGYSLPTAYKLLEAFEELGILEETTGFQRNRKFVFQQYLDLFQG
ncbi:MAG: hypothetical protein K9J37_20680 [Saprospiraceae bacterium]|nr:hypothetical protein [Saprospiraceae bacterium]